ncbi:hypothetical protein ACJW30_10G036000 [Castanea mollissima]
MADNICRSINMQPSNMSVMVNKLMLTPSMFAKSSAGQLTCRLKNLEYVEGDINSSIFLQSTVTKSITACEPDPGAALPDSILDHPVLCEDAKINDLDLGSIANLDARRCPLEARNVNDASKATQVIAFENESIMEGQEEEEEFVDSVSLKGETENPLRPFNTVLLDLSPENDFRTMKNVNSIDMPSSLNKEQKPTHLETRAVSPEADLSVAQKQLSKPSAKTKAIHKDGMALRLHALSKSLGHSKAVGSPKKKQQHKRDQTSVSMAQKLKHNYDDMHIKERRGSSTSVYPKDQQEPKVLPDFESYIVVEEEGSGGYGTVYRAKRRSDGVTVAIKCPHPNAHRRHVTNEQKMLERFGGKNFIIKYEGCFTNGNSDCFVLEHVEHDRPEVLKKEIDVLQLRWYGYCMFRALLSLHKQGIVHRDVKPGNFLFSRKAHKGYLIDFNLAMDLHQKYGNTCKSRMGYDSSINRVMVQNAKSTPPTKGGKFLAAKTLQAVNQETTKVSKSTLDPKNLKKKASGQGKGHNDLGSWNVIKSQGADGSGITSVKDVTSTRTPSAERRREPMPCQGRKELISLLQETMQSPNHEASSVPAPMRKRVAATPGKVDSKLGYITPMPLHSSVIGVAGAGLIKKRGDGKHKREGPCVGTKGFRAPEVLFKSPHQGPKVDIWSAGVTLLYLMIGRMPFFGDPEQNIKEISKFRGSEDLWEVAKLHDRESSFPVELYDTQSLPSTKLRDWCETNTKRPEFLEVIPRSLFDLVDKCLTVNPRLRINAEEALKHEFFAPCHEALRKERLCRQGFSLDSRTSHS